MRRTTTTATPATITLRLLTLGLAVAATACQSTPARADGPAAPSQSVPGGEVRDPAVPGEAIATTAAPAADPAAAPLEAPAATDSQNDFAPLEDVLGAAKPVPAPVTKKPKSKAASSLGPRLLAADPMAAQQLAYNTFARGVRRGGDPVAVVGTEPMEPAVIDAWREDLLVMDKLLRHAVSAGAASYRDMQPRVLGLDIKMNDTRVPPTYVEGAGVILTTAVGFPLLPGERPATQPERPRQRPSAWDRAKREVSGGGSGGGSSNIALGRIAWVPDGDEMGFDAQPAVEYDQARLDALAEAIVKALPEATNFRHLKQDEFVFVTIVGHGETGVPARLTLKAKKSDIDAAAKGTITPEAFKSRVATRVAAGAQASRPGDFEGHPTKFGGK
jgi:hypothetical protein